MREEPRALLDRANDANDAASAELPLARRDLHDIKSAVAELSGRVSELAAAALSHSGAPQTAPHTAPYIAKGYVKVTVEDGYVRGMTEEGFVRLVSKAGEHFLGPREFLERQVLVSCYGLCYGALIGIGFCMLPKMYREWSSNGRATATATAPAKVTAKATAKATKGVTRKWARPDLAPFALPLATPSDYLPLPLVHNIVSRLPADARLRLAEVSMAMRAVVADPLLWVEVDLSTASVCRTVSEALLDAVLATSTQLRSLDVSGKTSFSSRPPGFVVDTAAAPPPRLAPLLVDAVRSMLRGHRLSPRVLRALECPFYDDKGILCPPAL